MKVDKIPKIKIDVVPLVGGVDNVTTPVLVKPGTLLSSMNFEPDIFGGYRRMAGIERYDGRPRPSDASYWIMEVDTSGSFSVGDTITGVTSGVTGEVILITEVAVVSSGSGGFFDLLSLCGITASSPSAANLSILILAKVTGDFTTGEILNVGGSPQGTVVEVNQDSADTAILHAKYKNLAADAVRADIQQPPGSGAVRGAWHYNGDEYCFRDNGGGTACLMYKATSSGWSQITFGRELQFDNAVGEIFEGDTVTGLTSGATGVVKRSLLRTGTWSASGTGTLVFDSVTGAFQDNEAIQVTAVTKVTADGVDTAITLSPGGRFEFVNYNFTGTSATQRMYFVDGVNEISEFDGTRLVPIRTGIGSLKPKYIAGHKNHLFVGIGSSVQVSSIGDPYGWTALTGAAELGLGEECTGLLPQIGDATSGALVVATKSKIYILYGNSTADFNLVLHSHETGALPYTLQNIGYAHFMDARGINQLYTSQAFGGFQMSTLSNAMQPFIEAKQGKQSASCIVRKTNQYRLFFNDGEGLIVYFQPNGNGLNVSLMPFNYGIDKYMNTVCSFVDTDGTERIIASGSDGYVYELDRGTSIDGDPIGAYLMTSFIHSRSIGLRKRYKKAILQFRSGNTARVEVNYDLSYGDLDTTYGDFVDKSIAQPGGIWDTSYWEQFYWDSSYTQRIAVDTNGVGESISVLVSNDNDEDEPFTIHTCELHYLEGRTSR